VEKSFISQLSQTIARSFLTHFHIRRNPFGLDKGLWLVLLHQPKYFEFAVAWFRPRHCLTIIYCLSN
jgi:hypothetical protein